MLPEASQPTDTLSGLADGRTRQPQGTYLKEDMHDRFARIEMALLSELWVMRDRVAVLERRLLDRGVIEDGEIDSFQPDPAFDAHLGMLRSQMVENVLGAPYRNGLTVDDLKDRVQDRLAKPIRARER